MSWNKYKQGVVESLTNIWGGLLFTKTRRRTSGTFFTFLVSNSSRSWCTTRGLSWLSLLCKTFVMFSYSSFSYPCILISSYPHLSILSDTHLPPYPHQERFQLCFVQLLHILGHHDDDRSGFEDDYNGGKNDDDDNKDEDNDSDGYERWFDDFDLEGSIRASLMGGQHCHNVLPREVPFASQLVVL